MIDRDPFEDATADQLAEALRSETGERRTQAACAAGDRLRFHEIFLSDSLRSALSEIVSSEATWSDLRYESAIALCEAADPAGESLLELLHHKDRRFDAIKALSRLRTERVRVALRQVSSRWLLPWTDRLVASAALSALGDESGAAYFNQRLASRYFPMRRAMALHLLGDLRHPQAFELLTRIADTPDDLGRGVAIRALGHLGDKRALGPLQAIALAASADLKEDLSYAFDLLATEPSKP